MIMPHNRPPYISDIPDYSNRVGKTDEHNRETPYSLWGFSLLLLLNSHQAHVAGFYHAWLAAALPPGGQAGNHSQSCHTLYKPLVPCSLDASLWDITDTPIISAGDVASRPLWFVDQCPWTHCKVNVEVKALFKGVAACSAVAMTTFPPTTGERVVS